MRRPTLLRALAATALSAALVAPLRAQSGTQSGTQAGTQTAAQPAAPSTLVVLVRHAEKGTEPAADPPLTAAGEARAQALADVLADAHVDAVISTPTRRTQATGAPIATRRGLTPELVPIAGGVPAHAAAVAASIRDRHRGETVLVVEHSNTIAAIVRALGGPPLADLCDQQYASLFVLELPAAGPPKLVRSTYGAADAAGSCGSMK